MNKILMISVVVIITLGLFSACETSTKPTNNNKTSCDGIKSLCDTGFQCVNSSCVAVSKLECTRHSDCGAAELCQNNKCVPSGKIECTTFADCDADEDCIDNKCVDPDNPDGCKKDSDCDSDEICKDNKCVDKAPDVKTILSIKDKTITCGKEGGINDKIGTVTCPSGNCLVNFDPALPDGLEKKVENGKISIVSNELFDFNKCYELKDGVEIKVTAIDSLIPANFDGPKVFKLKSNVKKLNVLTTSLPSFNVGESVSIELKAEGGSDQYEWSDVSVEVICVGIPEHECDTTFKGIKDPLKIVNGRIEGTPTVVASYDIVLRVKDVVTGLTADSPKMELKAMEAGDFDVKLQLENSANAVTEVKPSTTGNTLTFGDIPVPFGSKLKITASGKSEYYIFEEYSSDYNLKSKGEKNVRLIEPNNGNEASGLEISIKNSAGQEKKVKISKVTFAGDPCLTDITIKQGDKVIEASKPIEVDFADPPGMGYKFEAVGTGPFKWTIASFPKKGALKADKLKETIEKFESKGDPYGEERWEIDSECDSNSDPECRTASAAGNLKYSALDKLISLKKTTFFDNLMVTVLNEGCTEKTKNMRTKILNFKITYPPLEEELLEDITIHMGFVTEWTVDDKSKIKITFEDKSEKALIETNKFKAATNKNKDPVGFVLRSNEYKCEKEPCKVNEDTFYYFDYTSVGSATAGEFHRIKFYMDDVECYGFCAKMEVDPWFTLVAGKYWYAFMGNDGTLWKVDDYATKYRYFKKDLKWRPRCDTESDDNLGCGEEKGQMEAIANRVDDLDDEWGQLFDTLGDWSPGGNLTVALIFNEPVIAAAIGECMDSGWDFKACIGATTGAGMGVAAGFNGGGQAGADIGSDLMK